MSNFRERTAEIVEQGKAERKSFAPKGAPMRVYNWWLANSDSVAASRISTGTRRENFCHWFWVVVLFAPALKVGKWLDRNAWVFAIPVVGIAITLVWALIDSFGIGSFLLGILGAVVIAAVLTGGILVIEALVERFPDAMAKIGIGIVCAVVGAVFLFLSYLLLFDAHIVVSVIYALLLVATPILIWKFQSIADYIEGREEIRIREAAARPVVETTTEPREPNAIERALKNIGEFIVMVAQFIRVKKWKTCPLIDVLPEQREDVAA